jgi:O-antigen ligase
LFLSFLPPLILALLLSRTRAWILGTVLSTALVLFLWAYKKLGLKRSITIFLILILLCPIFLGSLKAAFLDTFSYLFLRQKGMSSEVRVIKDIGEVYDLSLLQRYQIWDFALHIFARYPLTGIGVGNFRITSALRPELSEGVSGGGWSDNHYVNVLAETGIPGAIAWTYLVYLLLSCCFRILRSSGEEYRSATLGLTGSLLVFAVGGMFWNLTSGIIDSAIFALVISLTFSTKKIIDRNETQILNRVNLTKRDSH